jgi:ammonia channel protein AmtB
MEMAACAAVYVQESALDLDRAALGSKPLDLGLGLVVRTEAGFPALAAAVVLGRFHTKKSVDRENTEGYNSRSK